MWYWKGKFVNDVLESMWKEGDVAYLTTLDQHLFAWYD
jgi:hypothetical protein